MPHNVTGALVGIKQMLDMFPRYMSDEDRETLIASVDAITRLQETMDAYWREHRRKTLPKGTVARTRYGTVTDSDGQRHYWMQEVDGYWYDITEAVEWGPRRRLIDKDAEEILKKHPHGQCPACAQNLKDYQSRYGGMLCGSGHFIDADGKVWDVAGRVAGNLVLSDTPRSF